LRRERGSIGYLLFTFARLLLSTVLRRRGHAPLCRGKSGRIALPCAFLMCLAAHLDDAGKMPHHRLLQPTLRHAHPTIAQLPSSRLSPRRLSPRRASGEPVLKAPNACGSAAPDHLSAIQPRVARRLTPSHKLRSAPFTRLLCAVFVEEGTGPFQGAASPRRFQPPSKLTTRPLTLRVAPRDRPDKAER
jgi:hypothetical protein